MRDRKSSSAKQSKFFCYHLRQRRTSNDCYDDEKQVTFQYNHNLHTGKSISVQSKHTLKCRTQCTHICKSEQNPSKVYNDQQIDMLKYLRYPFKFLQQKGLFQNKEAKEIQSPENIIPAGSMPHSCQKPYDKQVKILTYFSFSVSSKRNVNIITEKRT